MEQKKSANLEKILKAQKNEIEEQRGIVDKQHDAYQRLVKHAEETVMKRDNEIETLHKLL